MRRLRQSNWILSLLFLAMPLYSKPNTHHTRVVLLSADAGSQSILDRLLASGALTGGAFERMTKRGYAAAGMTPAAVSSTPVSHPTIFTGAWPQQNGITGVAMPGKDLGDTVSGFVAPTSIDRLWTIAQQSGKHVV